MGWVPKLRGGFYEPSYIFFKDFPIKFVDPKNLKERNASEKIVMLVKEILTLNEQITEIKLPQKLEETISKIEHWELKIDELVYQLYGLTEEEIRIVEGK